MEAAATTAPNLDRSLVQGLAWTGGMKWATQIVSWAVTLVVARLLTPGDYGLMGMAMVYVGFAQLVSGAGLSAALIQDRELDQSHAAQLGALAALLGAGLCALSVLLAGAVAWAFHEPAVRDVVVVLSATFVLRGFQVLPRALLGRELRFRALAWIDAGEALVQAVGTLAFALAGLGYWALALGPVTGAAASLVLCLAWRPHRLAVPRSLAPIAHAVVFSSQVFVSQVAWYAYSNADFAVVGRFLGKVVLGGYYLAWTLASIPVDRITTLVARVVPPVFAAVQHDRRALGRYLCSITEGLALVTLPACVGIALVADVLVPVALGPRWAAVVTPLRLLALYAACRAVVALLPQVMVFTGHARRSMEYSVAAALVLPVVFFFGTRWGTAGVALGWVLGYPLLSGAMWLRSSLRIAGLSWGRYAAALWPAGRATGVMSAAVLGAHALLPAAMPKLVTLVALVGAGAVSYATVVFALDRRRVRGVLSLLRGPGGTGEPRRPQAPPVAASAATPAPVFATADAPANHRLLLITYHFPPDPAVGALRWQKLARFAAERGWGLDVIALHPRSLRAAEPERLEDLPPGVRVYGVPAPRLWIDRAVDGAWETLRRLRRNGGPAAAPPSPAASAPRVQSLARSDLWRPPRPRDAKRAYYAWLEYAQGRRWAAGAARAAASVAVPGVHRAVIGCGPPHWAHDAARRAAARTRLPYMMDLRDPWSLVQRLPELIASPVWYALARRGERRGVRGAALVVANTEPLAAAMRRRYPDAAGRITAVPNGCDDDPVPRRQRSRRFTIAYAGTIYLDRDPAPLFRAVARVAGELGLAPDQLGVELMGDVGTYDGRPLAEIAAAEGAGAYVRLLPPGPRQAALEFLARAHQLVVLPQDSDLAIPAKVFEYMRFDAWLLALAERGSATERLLRGSEADVVAPGDVAGLAGAIARRYAEFARGLHGRALSRHEPFTRRAQALRLFEALEAITGAPARPRTGTELCAAS